MEDYSNVCAAWRSLMSCWWCKGPLGPNSVGGTRRGPQGRIREIHANTFRPPVGSARLFWQSPGCAHVCPRW